MLSSEKCSNLNTKGRTHLLSEVPTKLKAMHSVHLTSQSMHFHSSNIKMIASFKCSNRLMILLLHFVFEGGWGEGGNLASCDAVVPPLMHGFVHGPSLWLSSF